VLGLTLLLAAGLAVLYVGVVGVTAWSLTHPPRRTYAWSVAKGRPGDPSELDEPAPFETWTFASRGRDLPVWDIEGQRAGGPVIICSHGWADSRLGVLVRLRSLRAEASRVIAWDGPGQGEAQGVCALGAREVDDLENLVARVEADAPIVLYGWSLGAGISIALASRLRDHRIAGVVAESPYVDPATPARGVIDAMGMPHRLTLPPALWLLGLFFNVGPRWSRGQGGGRTFDGFDRDEHAAQVRCPLLVLHGEHDPICPLEQGRRIAERAGHLGTLAVIRGAEHNDLWKDPQLAQACSEAVSDFLRREFTTRSAPQPTRDSTGAPTLGAGGET